MHPRLNTVLNIAGAAADLAVLAASAASRQARRARRNGPGYKTLRPGAATPLWNEVVKATLAALPKYGDQAKLARILGITRQQLNDMLRAKRRMPDAERTLGLLVWLAARTAGREVA